MRSNRRVAVAGACLGMLGLLAGCSDSTSPSARAWERAQTMARMNRAPMFNEHGQMAASDGLGGAIFVPADAPAPSASTTTFANVPTE